MEGVLQPLAAHSMVTDGSSLVILGGYGLDGFRESDILKIEIEKSVVNKSKNELDNEVDRVVGRSSMYCYDILNM